MFHDVHNPGHCSACASQARPLGGPAANILEDDLRTIRRGGLAPWQVRRALTYMSDNLSGPVRLGELADLVGLSRFHFCSAFRASTGATPCAMLRALRIDAAVELLRNPAVSITEIALAVGYETPSAFSASFRKVIGTTPLTYRRCLGPGLAA